jgi:hypothetical protein
VHGLVNATNCRTQHTTCGHEPRRGIAIATPSARVVCAGNAATNRRGVRQFVACTGEANWGRLLVDYCTLSERLMPASADAANQVGIE